MEVILLQRIAKLGQIGDIVNVKDGYARNFLIPREKGLRATEANKKLFETKKADLELQNLNLKKEAEAVFSKVDGLKLVLVKSAGESGFLYGSVKSQDIAKSLSESGYSVNKSQVAIVDPIKSLGVYELNLDLHPEVHAKIIVNVARSTEEAENQLNDFLSGKSKANLTKKEQEDAALFDALEKVEAIEKKQKVNIENSMDNFEDEDSQK
ncbi:MAG: 50S ribosomal protein L9 [Alphaproteobacteria bacterium]|jgi:large subunit ribosomal protein L9|nr:50S ribosomal protein L9 [Alphaproteobacteria bacterium]